jgi:hypothetical protein
MESTLVDTGIWLAVFLARYQAELGSELKNAYN